MYRLTRRSRGFTLIELMVSLLLGLILTLSVSSFLVNTLIQANKDLARLKAENTGSALLTLLGNELRRAGYRHASGVTGFDHVYLASSNSCILFSYSASTGTATPATVQGFRLNGSAVETASSTTLLSSISSATASTFCSTAANWNSTPLHSSSDLQVNALNFTPASAGTTLTGLEITVSASVPITSQTQVNTGFVAVRNNPQLN